MKILMVNRVLYARSASENIMFTLADALESLGHEVAWFTQDNRNNQPLDDTYSVAIRKTNHRLVALRTQIYDREVYDCMMDRISRGTIDAALIWNVSGTLTWAVVDALRKKGIPTWVMLTSGKPLCPSGNMTWNKAECHACDRSVWPCFFRNCLDVSMVERLAALISLKALRRRGYDQPTGYIVPSPRHEERLIASGLVSRPVLNAGLPLAAHFFEPASVARRGFFLYVGLIVEAKGVFTMIDALSHCINSLPLMIAGEGADLKRLQEVVHERGLDQRVRFLGHLLPKALRQVMVECDALIVPSECEEIAPWALLEAQALGKPVIASDHSVLPSRVEHEKTGFIFDTGSASDLAVCLDKLTDLNDEEYLDMCSAAWQFARDEYYPTAYAERVLDIIQNGAVVKGEETEEPEPGDAEEPEQQDEEIPETDGYTEDSDDGFQY